MLDVGLIIGFAIVALVGSIALGSMKLYAVVKDHQRRRGIQAELDQRRKVYTDTLRSLENTGSGERRE